mgnify:FL=1
MLENLNVLLKAGSLRLGHVSPGLRVADICYNTTKICEALERLAAQNCQFALFPELCLTGATCGDLFGQELMVQKSLEALEVIDQAVKKLNINAIVGLPIKIDQHLYNAAALLSPDGIQGLVLKTLLDQPFDQRSFSPAALCQQKTLEINGLVVPVGPGLLFQPANMPGCTIGIAFGDELLTADPTINQLALRGANLVLCPSAIPAELGSAQRIRDVVCRLSEQHHLVIGMASCGPNESTTDLVYSGQCLVADRGTLLAEIILFSFETQELYVNVKLHPGYDLHKAEAKPIQSQDKPGFKPNLITSTPFVPTEPQVRNAHCQEALKIQAAGLAKRIKFTSTQKLVLGLSGGMDSTLALLVSLRTMELLGIDKQNILALSMPGPGTSSRSQQKSAQLGELFGVNFLEIPIHEALNQHLRDLKHDLDLFDVTYENAQARERTQILMDKANQVSGLVVGTGDLSELALGWCTFNADHMSMYHVNAGVPKTLVKAILSWAAEALFTGEMSKLLHQVCDDPVTPELLPVNADGISAQDTEAIIGPYILHDFFLYHTLKDRLTPKEVFEIACQVFQKEFSPAEILHWLKVFYTRFFAQQYKRSTMPDGPKVTGLSLSPRGQWHMPSDASAALWLNEIKNIESELKSKNDI